MTKKFDYGDKEARYRKACERLDTEKPYCLLSSETSPFAIARHHVAGKAFHGELVPLSLNLHARVTNEQKDHPEKIEGCTSPLERIGHLLLGLGALVRVAAEDLHDPGLVDFLTYLDRWLKQLGLLLIEMARRAPTFDVGVEP